jgi:peptidoglycan/xylan/chitin deacetylase (PgdA/CDA1 family)
MVYDTRGRPLRAKFRSRRPGRRALGGPRRAIHMARYYAVKHARRRRFMARRFGLALMLMILVLGVFFYGGSSSKLGYVRPALPVEAGTMPGPPGTSPPDLGEVWAAAVAGDSSPNLATNGKTGTSGGRIALTFDDGPDPSTTPRILATLRRHDIEATFFVVGSQVERHPGLLRRIVEEGHTIGNHSYDHADMSYLTPGQIRLELQRTQKAVDKALGYHYQMKIMRPPYGEPYFEGSDALPAFRRIVRQEQLFPVIWTIDTQDYLMAGNPQGIVRSIVRQDGTGRRKHRDQVVLMHDIHPQDAQALTGIIDHFERSDRRFVSVNELLRDKYPEP